MTRNALLLTFAIFLFLSGCSSVKVVRLMKSGRVAQDDYSVQIPFEYRLGLMVIQVQISGETYDFLLDTGAPNVISRELAEKLGLKRVTQHEVRDSQGQAADLGFTTLKKVSIGGIDFLDTGAIIAELTSSTELACLKVDGLIGSNLMRKATWRIDFQDQMISVAPTAASLRFPQPTHRLSFETKVTGTPIVDVRLNGVTEKNVEIDTGSNGSFSLSKRTLDSLIQNDPAVPVTYGFGRSSAGLHGKGIPDSSFLARVPVITLGNLSLDSTVVDFADQGSSLIGTKFLKHYDLLIDWFSREILLIPKSEIDDSTFSTFGFSYSLRDNRLIVSKLYAHLMTQEDGLQLGDQILSMDGISYENLTQAQWCDLMEQKPFSGDKLSIHVLRNGDEHKFVLKKVRLL